MPRRSSHKARLTELNTSDATEEIASETVFQLGIQIMALEERVIAVGKKRDLHPVFYQRGPGLNADTLEFSGR